MLLIFRPHSPEVIIRMKFFWKHDYKKKNIKPHEGNPSQQLHRLQYQIVEISKKQSFMKLLLSYLYE